MLWTENWLILRITFLPSTYFDTRRKLITNTPNQVTSVLSFSVSCFTKLELYRLFISEWLTVKVRKGKILHIRSHLFVLVFFLLPCILGKRTAYKLMLAFNMLRLNNFKFAFRNIASNNKDHLICSCCFFDFYRKSWQKSSNYKFRQLS